MSPRGHPTPLAGAWAGRAWQFFWATGLISSSWQRATTDLVATSIARTAAEVVGVPTRCGRHHVGAVFIAETYIGKAELMVRAIAESASEMRLSRYMSKRAVMIPVWDHHVYFIGKPRRASGAGAAARSREGVSGGVAQRPSRWAQCPPAYKQEVLSRKSEVTARGTGATGRRLDAARRPLPHRLQAALSRAGIDSNTRPWRRPRGTMRIRLDRAFDSFTEGVRRVLGLGDADGRGPGRIHASRRRYSR